MNLNDTYSYADSPTCFFINIDLFNVTDCIHKWMKFLVCFHYAKRNFLSKTHSRSVLK